MTIDEFFEALKKIGYNFGTDSKGRIRSTDRLGVCPLEAVAHRRGMIEARELLGLSSEEGAKIVCAADNFVHLSNFDANLRKRLLDTLSLVELPWT